MSQENVEIGGFRLFNRRDLDIVLALMDPEVELMVLAPDGASTATMVSASGGETLWTHP